MSCVRVRTGLKGGGERKRRRRRERRENKEPLMEVACLT